MFGSIIRGISQAFLFLSFGLKNIYMIMGSMFVQGISSEMVFTPYRTIIADFSVISRRLYFYGRSSRAHGIGISIGCFIGFTYLGTINGIMDGNASNYLLYAVILVYALADFVGAFIIPRSMRALQSLRESEESEGSISIPKGVDLSKEISESSLLKCGCILLLITFGMEALIGAFTRPFIIAYLSKTISCLFLLVFSICQFETPMNEMTLLAFYKGSQNILLATSDVNCDKDRLCTD